MPAYQDIPLATDKLSVSQDDIKNNFLVIKALVDVNHNTFAAGVSPEGKHKFVTMPEQGAAPATLANEGAVYTKVGTAPTARTELFFRRESDGAELNMTSGTTVGGGTKGWSYLPSGILMKWGYKSANDEDDVTFATELGTSPAFTAAPIVMASPYTSTTATDSSIQIGPTTTLKFKVFCKKRTSTDTYGAPMTFNWIAIGA